MTKGIRTLGLALALLVGLQAGAEAREGKLTVVELFTSQGCSSCPPADEFLGELAEREGVLALSFHVDYWDYIGWKDPYASARHSERQRDYARHLRLKYVYTPQMVIQGAVHSSGANRRAVEIMIKSRSRSTRGVTVALKADEDGMLKVVLPDGPDMGECDIWLVAYDSEHVTPVRRGENSGRTIRNRNVVRTLRHLATWDGGALNLAAERPEGDGFAVLIQSRKNGHIMGAARLTP